jgi:hypothetical protein
LKQDITKDDNSALGRRSTAQLSASGASFRSQDIYCTMKSSKCSCGNHFGDSEIGQNTKVYVRTLGGVFNKKAKVENSPNEQDKI